MAAKVKKTETSAERRKRSVKQSAVVARQNKLSRTSATPQNPSGHHPNASQYTIRKGVPIPPRRAAGRTRKYPLDRMVPGDFLILPVTYAGARSICRAFVKNNHNDWKFKIVTAGERTTHVWRIE